MRRAATADASSGEPHRLYVLERPRTMGEATVVHVSSGTGTGEGVTVSVDAAGLRVSGAPARARSDVAAVTCRGATTRPGTWWVVGLWLSGGERAHVFRSPSEDQALALATYLEQALGLPSDRPVSLQVLPTP